MASDPSVRLAPAVVIHGLVHARSALRFGAPVTLLSAPGAGLYAGCLFWRELVRAARAEYPDAAAADILDCGDGSGQALAALRIGQRRLILARSAPGWQAVAAIAAAEGGAVLEVRPSALDLAEPGSMRRLPSWLGGAPDAPADDSKPAPG